MSAALRNDDQDCFSEPEGTLLDGNYPVTTQYQLGDLLEIAKITNTLAFLSSSNDKMFVSFSMIKHSLVSSQRSSSSQKKSIALLSPTRSAESSYRIYLAKLINKLIPENLSGLRLINNGLIFKCTMELISSLGNMLAIHLKMVAKWRIGLLRYGTRKLRKQMF